MSQGQPQFRLDHIKIQCDDPQSVANFYARALQMKCERLQDTDLVCRGRERRVVFGKGEQNQLGFASFVTSDAAQLKAIRDRVESKGHECGPSHSPLFTREDAFSVKDPDGNIFNFSAADEADQEEHDGMVARLQHVVVKSRNIEGLLAFYTDVVGFTLSDRVETPEGELKACFLRGDNEHHCVAIFGGSSDCLDHHSYEVGTWDLIRDWGDHLSDEYIKIMWGPGRHGAGNNLFFMFDDPEKNWIELSAELEIVTDRPVEIWEHTERSLNLWGKGHIRT